MAEDTVEEIKRRKLEELRSSGTPSTPAEPIALEAGTAIDALLTEHRVTLVDCHAEWCGPCHQVKPIVQRIAAETAAAVVTVDIDQHRELAMEWGVRSVPTLLLFVDGNLAERLIGVQTFDRLAELVTAHASG